ncbi:SGNH/GDSL hydrolase family protein [Bradyrhizobium sp. Leo170]|uniref:SGNH/GDSL hydrolase family protein n=1 Tax=Bradyrhizobium sp. Leo170 TaxID=1571199 RepID=UPI0032E3CA80
MARYCPSAIRCPPAFTILPALTSPIGREHRRRSSAGKPYPTQAAYVANMKSLAYAANVPFIDIWGLFGGTWNSSAMNDPLHPNQTGYALIAGYAGIAILDPSARSLS